MVDVIVIFLLLLGSFFILLSAIGILKMPDLYTRLSTLTKANTVGIGSMMTALAIYFYYDVSVVTRSITAIVFIYISVPISGHFIARVAYFIGINKWKETKEDKLQHKFGINKKANN